MRYLVKTGETLPSPYEIRQEKAKAKAAEKAKSEAGD